MELWCSIDNSTCWGIFFSQCTNIAPRMVVCMLPPCIVALGHAMVVYFSGTGRPTYRFHGRYTRTLQLKSDVVLNPHLPKSHIRSSTASHRCKRRCSKSGFLDSLYHIDDWHNQVLQRAKNGRSAWFNCICAHLILPFALSLVLEHGWRFWGHVPNNRYWYPTIDIEFQLASVPWRPRLNEQSHPLSMTTCLASFNFTFSCCEDLDACAFSKRMLRIISRLATLWDGSIVRRTFIFLTTLWLNISDFPMTIAPPKSKQPAIKPIPQAATGTVVDGYLGLKLWPAAEDPRFG